MAVITLATFPPLSCSTTMSDTSYKNDGIAIFPLMRSRHSADDMGMQTQTWIVNGSVVSPIVGRAALRAVKSTSDYTVERDASGEYHMSGETIVHISNRTTTK